MLCSFNFHKQIELDESDPLSIQVPAPDSEETKPQVCNNSVAVCM